MYFLTDLRTLFVISFTDGASLGTYCDHLRTYYVRFCTNVEEKKQDLFIGLIPFQVIN